MKTRTLLLSALCLAFASLGASAQDKLYNYAATGNEACKQRMDYGESRQVRRVHLRHEGDNLYITFS